MKKLIILLAIIFTAEFSFSQKVENSITKFWWSIHDVCFSGTSVTKKNGMFMSTAQNIPVGATYVINKTITGKVKGASLDLTHETIKKEVEDFPDKVDNPSSNPPCSFDLKNIQNYQLDIVANLTDQSNIGKISAELQTILKNATALKLTITSWGFEILEQGKVELCFRNNFHNNYINFLRNGKRYIVLTAIWINGVELNYELDKETITKIKAIYESNKEALLNAGITLNFSSSTVLSTAFKYDEKFYPFYRFGRITKNGEIKSLVDEVLMEPDFSEYNNELLK